FAPTTPTTSSSISSARTPSPTPTLKASSPSFAAPTSSPSASCTPSGNTASDASPAGASDTVESFTAVPPLIFGGSPRTLPTRADEAGGTAVKFYELRDNLPFNACRASVSASLPHLTSFTRENQIASDLASAVGL